MSKIKLNQLEMLIAVVENKGFSAAAAVLGCTQSRISHAIVELEQHLNTRLLHRSRTGCEPTPAGARIVKDAHKVMHFIDNIEQIAAETPQITGRIRVACFRSATAYILPPCLEALAKSWPDIHLDIDDTATEYHHIDEAVASGRADIGLTIHGQLPDIHSVPYVSDAYVLLVPKTFRLTSPFSWRQLENLSFIQPNANTQTEIIERCREMGLRHEVRHKLASDSGIVGWVNQGIGFSIIPWLSVLPVPENIRVLELPQPLRRHLFIITRMDNRHDRIISIFTNFLRDKALIRTTGVWRSGMLTFDY
ncbi:LysR family transcriptional regulator [uncultured Cedecea sp.]|uniref:LysR family transcriptional regulator n=1 Tax=uncultured Cedecea sp. TaxID=988762 RepID=UPI0026151E73|nr:LysR family transcriptional regulator [uncultured Cedecea sp.]